MKKYIFYLALAALVLSACAGVGLVAEEPPTQPSAEKIETAPGLGSSVILNHWNAEKRQFEIYPADPATGEALPGYAPIATLRTTEYLMPQAFHVFSADGALLAVIETRDEACEPFAGGTSCRMNADALHLVDLRTWQEQVVELSGDWASALVFSPDGSQLALTLYTSLTNTLMVFDTASGELLAQRELAFRPEWMAFARDGTALALYGQPLSNKPGITQPDPPHVLLADAHTLETIWEQELAEVTAGSWCLENCDSSHEMVVFASWAPAVIFSPDGNWLFIAHADHERLSVVDLSKLEVREVEISQASSWFERFLELTGGVAYAKGATQGASQRGRLAGWDAPVPGGNELRFSQGWERRVAVHPGRNRVGRD
jgi:hypothetical protein